MPHAAAKSVCTERQRLTGPCTAAVGCHILLSELEFAEYNSASPLEKEMTPCVVELVSRTDFQFARGARTVLAFFLLWDRIAFSECVETVM